MSAIGPGDWVECLTDGHKGYFRKGGLYCVESVVAVSAGCELCSPGRLVDHGGLEFTATRKSTNGLGWAGCAFRPIYRPKSSLLEGLLKPADTPAEPERVNA